MQIEVEDLWKNKSIILITTEALGVIPKGFLQNLEILNLSEFLNTQIHNFTKHLLYFGTFYIVRHYLIILGCWLRLELLSFYQS